MRHAVIALNYQCKNSDIIYDNIQRAGVKIDKIKWIDQEGICAAINAGIAATYPDYDIYTILANDIIEPDQWLMAREMSLQGPYSIVSIKLDEEPERFQVEEIIANYSIKKEVIDRIGGFNNVYDPYGPIDLDYCHRARVAGFYMSYIPGFMAKHIQNDNRDTVYGYSKEEKVQEKWGLLVSNLTAFNPTNIYIPVKEEVIK